MAKNNKNKGAKTPKAPQMPPKQEAPAVEEAQSVEEKTPMTPTLAEVTLGQIVKGEVHGLDANHMVDLNGQIVELFVKNQRATDMFGTQVVETMTKVAAIGCVAAVADAIVRGDSTFAITLKQAAYNDFAKVALEMGVKMPTLNALPAPDANGNVTVSAAETKVTKETKEQVKKEQKLEAEGDAGQYEMDPTKLVDMGEEELKKSLNYLFLTNSKKKGNSLNNTLADGVEFMKKFRTAEAEKAENKDEALAKLDDRTMYDWMEDVMSFIDPSLYLTGVAKATFGSLRSSGSPLTAFTTFRSMLMTKTNGNGPAWNDQEIVDALCAILRWEIGIEIAAEEKGKAALDPNTKGYRETATVFENKIKELNGYLNVLINPSFDIVEKFDTQEGDEDTRLMGAARVITKFYYPECKPENHYKNLTENVRQRMGIILNMFRSAGNKNQSYSEANLTTIEEYTEEEWKEYQENITKEAEKAREELDKAKKDHGLYTDGKTADIVLQKEKLKAQKAEREAKKAAKKDQPICILKGTDETCGSNTKSSVSIISISLSLLSVFAMLSDALMTNGLLAHQ